MRKNGQMESRFVKSSLLNDVVELVVELVGHTARMPVLFSVFSIRFFGISSLLSSLVVKVIPK